MKKVGLIVAFLSLIILFYLGFLRYIRVDEIKMSGYGLSSTQIKQNLQANETPESHQNLSLIPVSEYETIYQRGNEYYIGEKKKESINLNYPIISEDGSRVLNQSNEVIGITSEYEKINLYKNAVIANGEIYHIDDGVKAEEENYIFLEIEPNIYMSLQDLTIKTNTTEYTIKKNSYVFFEENFIRYYNYDENTYQYFSYDDLDAKSEVTVTSEKTTYEDFLIQLGIKEPEEENIPQEETPIFPSEEETPENPEEPSEIPTFIKPEVSVTNLQVSTYSITFDLNIQDQTGRIKKSPTFELYINDRLYKRNGFSINGKQEITKLLPNTTYKILGYYTYYNEIGEQVRNTFYETEFTTKGIDGLEKINLSYDGIEPGSTYANIKGLYITNEKESEVLKGIDHFAIEIEGEEYPFSSSINSLLTKLEKVEYTTPYILKSNTEYTVYIKAYDVGGNELEVTNQEIPIKTSKQIPIVNVEITNTDITQFTANLQIENPDKVNIQNLIYTVVDTNNQVIKEGEATESFTVNNLNENTIYTMYIYGDYDLEDGVGNHVKEKLKEVKLSTVPVASLGYLQVNITNDDIKQEEATFDFSVNSLSTDQRYMALLNKIIIHVYEKETGKEVDTIEYTEEKIENLRKGGTEKLNIKNLTSKTEYEMEIESSIKQGDKEYPTEAISNVGEFQTKKKEASISILNKFTTSNMIDFDVKVRDEDNSINSNRVILEVRNASGSLLSYQEIGINEEYKRVILNNLEVNQKYTFTYIAEDYNIGYNNDTNEENKVLYEEEIITEEGISGSINLESLLKQLNGKNKFDIEDEQRWTNTLGTSTSDLQEYNYEGNSTSFTVISGTKTYAYYLPEYAGKEITISFKARKENSTNNLPAYVVNGNSLTKEYEIANLTNEYQEYAYTFTLNNTGYIGFYLEEATGGTTKITFKDIQIEEGNTKTSYEAYQKGKKKSRIHIKIEDKRNEITNQKYYIQKYKNNEFMEEMEYSLEEGYEKTLEEEVEDNATYKFILQVKIRDRYYTLDELEFDTTEEIRSITTIDEFFGMHPYGNYVVTADLDFRNDSRIYNIFSGTIDFQGHKVYLASRNRTYLINYQYGNIKNLDLRIYLDHTSSKTFYYGLMYRNYGIVSNVNIVLEESENFNNENVALLGSGNYGTIENFVIHAKSSLYASYYSAYLVRDSDGFIRNGYIYGNSLVSYPTTQTNRYIGSVAGFNHASGKIENVYSLVDVDTLESKNEVDKQVGNLVGRNVGTIQNSYSVGSGENRDLSLDVNMGVSSGNTSNLYYVSDDLYAGDASIKISPMALRNVDFQNGVLNQDQAFLVDENVSQGYYPQIDWPDCMPAQELLPLPEVKDADLVDVLSVENVTQEENTITATILISNPSLENITDIKIQYVTTKIINQETKNGTTKVTLEINNPVFYIEDYLVESISAIGISNISYTREYESGERTLKLDLYRPVYSINDWKEIKNSSSESYKLMDDLDFQNQPADTIRLGDFHGKLNGNNHTIKNIEITNGNPMITNLYGTIENLFVENYKHNTSYARTGLIYRSQVNSLINNVQVSSIQLGAQNHIGGIVGFGNGGIIRNSSVSNFSLYDDIQNTSNLQIGGLVGYAGSGTQIQNSYVQNLNIETPDLYSIQAIGGVVGYLASGSIQNVYATGNITTAASNIGGIVGLNDGSIQNTYSMVNIYSKGSYIGGIVGSVSEGSSTVSINNNLALGDIYTSSDTVNVGRIVGNSSATYTNSYAWNRQHINGELSTANSNILLSNSELQDIFTYTNRIFLGDAFDYSEVANGILPKLYTTDKRELLPNQEDIYLPIREFEKKEIVVDNRITEGTILLTLENPNNYEITGITIEDLEIVSISRNTTNNGESILQIEVKPEKAFDSYRLTEIEYQVNGEKRISKQAIKIPLQFYKDLETYEDWQEISTEVAENYRLVGDIDFQNRENTNFNVLFNRLEGTGEGHTLKNIRLEVTGYSQGLIYSINNSMKSINFENVEITQISSSTRHHSGIIINATGTIENISFTNITINAAKTTYVGAVSNLVNATIQNISMNNINVTGYNYTGGLVGYVNVAYITNIKGSEIRINGNQYVGGIIGFQNHQNKNISDVIDGVVASNIIVEAVGNYVGSIIGQGNAKNIRLDDCQITGNSYVGGVIGYVNDYSDSLKNSILSNITVKGTGNYIGGYVGQNHGASSNITISNSKIIAPNVNSQYVGGVMGSYISTLQNIVLKDVQIISDGNYVGGVVGIYNGGIIRDIVTSDIIVEGNSFVGGIVGMIPFIENVYMYRITSNAVVTANISGAGGIIGQANRGISILHFTIYNIIAENSVITAPIHAGGIVGEIDSANTFSNAYNLFVAANVETTAAGSSPGMLVGNGDNYATNMTRLGIYNESKLISPSGTNNVGDLTIPGIEPSSYVTASDLALQNTYTSRGFSTAYFDYSELQNGYYPFLKNIDREYITLVPLPVSSQNMISLMSLMSVGYMNNLYEYHELPEYEVYISGVNSINIEFSKIDPETMFTINGQSFFIEQRVYSFTYHFDEDIAITLSDGWNSKEKVYSSEELKQTLLTYKEYYYFLKDGKVVSNDGGVNGLEGINMFNQYILLKDGKVYNIETREIKEGNLENFKMIEPVPLYSFSYDTHTIDTYYEYSVIDKERVIEQQILKKNSQIEMLSPSLSGKKTQIIMDSYNNKEYLTLLIDGKIVDLKEKIEKPVGFKNKGIEEISNNIYHNSNIVIVRYENGEVIVFNYRTGNIVYTTESESKIDIVSYFVNNFSITNNNVFENNENALYEESKEMKSILNEYDITKVMNEESDAFIQREYITSYDPIKEKYVIYDVSSLVENKEYGTNIVQINTEQSINDVISMNNSLNSFYTNQIEIRVTTKKIYSLIIFIFIFLVIGVLIFLSGKLLLKNKKDSRI